MAVEEEHEPYWLGRASDEQLRLAKQHFIWTKSIGYLLHPSISATLPPDALIADIGTGTGIWMTETAAISPPTYQFHGYDISAEQFMAADSLPKNVVLTLGDFKKPFPEEMKGKYDLVNIRLIIISMGNDVWQQTLKNVLTLLKPGGAIQWIEGDFFVSRGFRGASPTSPSGHTLTRIQQKMNGDLKKRFGFNFPDFTQLFEGAGLQEVEEDLLSTDRLVEQRKEFTALGVGAVMGGLANLARLGEKGFWSVGECEEWKEKALGEMEAGAYMRWDIHVTVGFASEEKRED